MSSNSLANNNAVRLGAIALLGTVLVYWLWASSSSTTTTTSSTSSAKKTLKDTTQSKQAETTSEDEEKRLSSTTSSSLTIITSSTTTTTTTAVKQESEVVLEQETHLERAQITLEKDQIEVVIKQVEDQTEAQTREENVIATGVISEPPTPVVEAMVEQIMEEAIEAILPEVCEKVEVAIEAMPIEEEAVEAEEEAVTEAVTEEAVEELVQESVIERSIEVEINTPSLTSETDVQVEDTQDTTEEEEEEVVTPSATIRYPTNAWSTSTEDKAQTLQEVSRVAQHSELNAKAAEFKPTWLPTSAPVAFQPAVATPRAAAPQDNKMKPRCRFWPKCTNKSCKFTHPSLPCRDPIGCEFGDRCKFIHPNDLTRGSRDNKGESKRNQNGRKKRPQSSDSSETMIAATPEEAWTHDMN